jgi:hypothetical protein
VLDFAINFEIYGKGRVGKSGGIGQKKEAVLLKQPLKLHRRLAATPLQKFEGDF